MPNYLKKNRTVNEIMDRIEQEAERDPVFQGKMMLYNMALRDMYDKDFRNMGDVNGRDFASYIQLGGASFNEVLQGRKATRDEKFAILSALAASKEMEGKKDTFQIYLPDGKGNVTPTPIVKTSEMQQNAPQQSRPKIKLGLWDSFCNLLGYKTEKFKAYETQKKQEEMEQQLRSREQAEMEKQKLLGKAAEGREQAEKIVSFQEMHAERAMELSSRTSQELFGKEDVDGWQLKDGTKLSPRTVYVGVMKSKEVGEPKLLEEYEDKGSEYVAQKYPDAWNRACRIFHDLDENRERLRDKDILRHLVPHEKADYAFLKSSEDKKFVLDGKGVANQWTVGDVQVKGQLYKAMKDDRFTLTPAEELIKEEIYNASLVKQTEKALKKGCYEKAAELSGKMLKSQLYKDSLERIMRVQMWKKDLGEKVTELTKQDMRDLKKLVEAKVENTGLLNDKSPLGILKTSSLAMSGHAADYMKMDITLNPENGLKAADLMTASVDKDLSTAENILRSYEEQKPLEDKGISAEQVGDDWIDYNDSVEQEAEEMSL